MASTAQTYRSAAKENLGRAQALFEGEEYFLAHYLAGLAAECHLRAYLRRKTNVFNSRHDLQELAKESGYYRVVPPAELNDFSARFGLLSTRWRSNHRFYSERQLLDYMNDIGAEFSLKGARTDGSRWKNLSRTVLVLAHEIINQGEAKWDSALEKS